MRGRQADDDKLFSDPDPEEVPFSMVLRLSCSDADIGIFFWRAYFWESFFWGIFFFLLFLGFS